MTLTNKNRGLVDGDLEWLRGQRRPRGVIGADYDIPHNARIDRILQALSTTQEEDEDEGPTRPEDDPKVQDALRYLEARGYVLRNRAFGDPTPVKEQIERRLTETAPATPPEREAVERLGNACEKWKITDAYTGTDADKNDQLEKDIKLLLSILDPRHAD